MEKDVTAGTTMPDSTSIHSVLEPELSPTEDTVASGGTEKDSLEVIPSMEASPIGKSPICKTASLDTATPGHGDITRLTAASESEQAASVVMQARLDPALLALQQTTCEVTTARAQSVAQGKDGIQEGIDLQSHAVHPISVLKVQVNLEHTSARDGDDTTVWHAADMVATETPGDAGLSTSIATLERAPDNAELVSSRVIESHDAVGDAESQLPANDAPPDASSKVVKNTMRPAAKTTSWEMMGMPGTSLRRSSCPTTKNDNHTLAKTAHMAAVHNLELPGNSKSFTSISNSVFLLI